MRSLVYVSILSCFLLQDAAAVDREPPNFNERMQNFCSSHPYDCNDDGIVTPYLLNTFLYEFYLKVESYFFNKGFNKAEFEYCHRYVYCEEEGVSVKNSKYKITHIFPKKRDYFEAFGGVNRNSGVYFSKPLSQEEADYQCSVKPRQANELSSRARREIEEGENSIWHLRSKYYKKYSLTYVEYLPKINSLDQPDNTLPTECRLTYKTKMIVFETKEIPN